MHRIILSILFALTLSFSSPVYVTISATCTDTINAHDTSITLPQIGESLSYTFLYDTKIPGSVSNYWGQDNKIGIHADCYPAVADGDFKLEDHEFPQTPKEGIKSMNVLYTQIDYQDGSEMCIIDIEHIFYLRFDCPPGIIDSSVTGTGGEFVALEAPLPSPVILPDTFLLELPNENDTCYTGFFFKFYVTGISDTPPINKYISTIYVPDINSNGLPEIVSLYVNKNNGNNVVSLRDINSGEVINKIVFFNNNWHPEDLSMVSDINGNYSFELSVLAVNKKTGKVQVRIKDGETGELLKRVSLPR